MQNKQYCVSALVQTSASCIDQSELTSNFLVFDWNECHFFFFGPLFIRGEFTERTPQSDLQPMSSSSQKGKWPLSFTHLGIWTANPQVTSSLLESDHLYFFDQSSICSLAEHWTPHTLTHPQNQNKYLYCFYKSPIKSPVSPPTHDPTGYK